MERLPPAGRSTSRFAPTYRANETLESVFQSSADLRGPLSELLTSTSTEMYLYTHNHGVFLGPTGTIPDSMQARDNSSGDGPEEAAYTSRRETDAVSAVPWSAYFDSAEDVRVSTRGATFRLEAGTLCLQLRSSPISHLPSAGSTEPAKLVLYYSVSMEVATLVSLGRHWQRE